VIDGQPSAGKGWPGGIGSGNACEHLGSITCTSVVSSLGGMLEPERLRIAAAADSIQQDIAIRGGAFESLRQAQDDKIIHSAATTVRNGLQALDPDLRKICQRQVHICQ
jgi:hypothetical protein